MFYILLPAALLGGFVFYASKKPDTFVIRREAIIDAPAEKIQPLIADLRKWEQWSPWEGRDPAMQRRYSGAESGVGSKYEFIGNNKVGHGSMEVVEAARSYVRIDLHFLKPFEAQNVAEFSLAPEGDKTHVEWKMSGPANLMTKVMHTALNMDKVIGKDFEDGLNNLKRITA